MCRFSDGYDEAELWFQINHVPIDGVPMQEVLQDLKEQWGIRGNLKFPPLSYNRKIVPELCSTKDSKSGIYHVSQFMDFQPFLKVRKELNERYANQIEGNITVVSMLAWGLAHHHAFDNVKFVIPIDLPACTGQERTLGFIFIRPSFYFDKDNPEEGFLKFQREFNRRFQATKERRSESYELLEVFALTPPLMYSTTLKLMPSALAEFTGTVGITIIKDADFFVAPLSDTHTDGFLAFGNFLVPIEGGGMAGAVSIKGPKGKVEDYLVAINEAVKDFYQYF